MQIGIIYPQTEYSNDPFAIKDYAQTAEGLGYSHILAYDHVLGANPNRPEGFQGPYTYQDPFQEPFMLFSFMAAVTQRIGFTTGIIILPQRQTALVAKQTATLDVLSGGRLRLGLGIGWNAVEYTSLGMEFHNRGRRFEEQVQVLKLLWTQPLVTFSGKWHNIPDTGINPLPVQQPVPIWLGGRAEAVLRRAANLADGWMPTYRTADSARPALDVLHQFLEQAGKSRQGFGIEARLSYGDGNFLELAELLKDWERAGATHLTLNTMGLGFKTPQAHLDAIRRFAKEFVVP